MTKANITIMPAYFDRYINLAEDEHFLTTLEISLQELQQAPIDKWSALGNNVYAPGKWTVKDILQHYIDTERVFTYRITAFARGDKQRMLSFDEDTYAKNTNANERTVNDLVEELILVRKGYIAMYKSFTPAMLMKTGFGFDGNEIQVLAMAYMIAGHQRWHFKVLEEKYYPLLSQ